MKRRKMTKNENSKILDDGCGNIWYKCHRKNCGLQIVRPGKVQCWCDGFDGIPEIFMPRTEKEIDWWYDLAYKKVPGEFNFLATCCREWKGFSPKDWFVIRLLGFFQREQMKPSQFRKYKRRFEKYIIREAEQCKKRLDEDKTDLELPYYQYEDYSDYINAILDNIRLLHYICDNDLVPTPLIREQENFLNWIDRCWKKGKMHEN